MGNTKAEEQELLELRRRIFITGYKGGMAHLASCFSCLEMLYALYVKGILRYEPGDPEWEDRDRFILSKGHAGLALYSVLEKAGLISGEMLDSYLTADARIGGEPCMRDCEWIEATTGSLGHGLSMGLGMAMGLKLNKSPARVFVMVGDGELQEGTVWEALQSAPAFGVGNLTVIVDSNRIQKMDLVENTIGDPNWEEKFRSFGWDVSKTDGHDIAAFSNAVLSENTTGRPRMIIADTVKGKGVSIMENNPNWHFKLPGRKELKYFMEELSVEKAELER